MRPRKGSIQTPPTVVTPLKKCLFVSNFNTICGVPAEEDSLLSWCLGNDIKILYCYDMSTILSSTYSVFAAFYTKAISEGITAIFGQRGSENRLIGIPFNSSKNYNLANPTKRINAGFENEFWNYNLTGPNSNQMVAPNVGNKEFPDALGNVIYRYWIQQQKAIYTYNKSVGLKSDFYIGHLHDDVENTPPEQIALDMVNYSDNLHLSWYVTTSEFNSSDAGLNYVSTRFNLLGDAANSLGKTVNIIPIFAGTAPLMQSYFTGGKTLLNAFNRALSVYNSNPGGILTSKQKIYIAGFNGYAIPR